MKYKIIPPEKKTIRGQVYISFRDCIYNLLVQQLNGEAGQSFTEFNKKVKRKAETKLSPRHRKRILRQAKRMGA